MAADHARRTAAVLVEAELLGRPSHGLVQLPRYLEELGRGALSGVGEPETRVDAGSWFLWSGNGLPGPALLSRAVESAVERLPGQGMVCASIRDAHHFGCLGAYLLPAVDAGAFILIACCSPKGKTVAPFGGRTGTFGTSPLAVGIPTGGQPILIDLGMASTAFNYCRNLHRQGGRLPHPWLLDGDGRPTDDPGVLFDGRGGTILPLGGSDLGHKGFALALMVQALTSALSGYDRAADRGRHRRQNALVLLMNPQLFGGDRAFRREMDRVAADCAASPAAPGSDGVRLPGARALRRRAEQLAGGVELPESTLAEIETWRQRLA